MGRKETRFSRMVNVGQERKGLQQRRVRERVDEQRQEILDRMRRAGMEEEDRLQRIAEEVVEELNYTADDIETIELQIEFMRRIFASYDNISLEEASHLVNIDYTAFQTPSPGIPCPVCRESNIQVVPQGLGCRCGLYIPSNVIPIGLEELNRLLCESFSQHSLHCSHPLTCCHQPPEYIRAQCQACGFYHCILSTQT